jgi:hypothetical protein
MTVISVEGRHIIIASNYAIGNQRSLSWGFCLGFVEGQTAVVGKTRSVSTCSEDTILCENKHMIANHAGSIRIMRHTNVLSNSNIR